MISLMTTGRRTERDVVLNRDAQFKVDNYYQFDVQGVLFSLYSLKKVFLILQSQIVVNCLIPFLL